MNSVALICECMEFCIYWIYLSDWQYCRIFLFCCRTCEGTSIVPNGPGYPTTLGPNQICTLRGAQAGNPLVSGEDYIVAAYTYSKANVWRNFGFEVSFPRLSTEFTFREQEELIHLFMWLHNISLLS